MMLLLLLLQVLASCLWLGHGEVVGANFFGSQCLQFFFHGTPPNGALTPRNPAWICQRYQNKYYFATLYDRDLRIPVYSAYLYQPLTGVRPGNPWMVEAQLVGPNYPKNMEDERTLKNNHIVSVKQLRQSQALYQDYKNLKGLNRGHLNPSGHQNVLSSKKATFTLTNIVPQDAKLNGGAWKNYENQTMKNMTQGCSNTYVVVGAVPGKSYISNGRVNKPSYIWSSACCDLGTNNAKAWGVIADNNRDYVELLTLGELEKRLSAYYKKRVSLFHSSCPRE